MISFSCSFMNLVLSLRNSSTFFAVSVSRLFLDLHGSELPRTFLAACLAPIILTPDESANRALGVSARAPTLSQLQVENKLAPKREPGFFKGLEGGGWLLPSCCPKVEKLFQHLLPLSFAQKLAPLHTLPHCPIAIRQSSQCRSRAGVQFSAFSLFGPTASVSPSPQHQPSSSSTGTHGMIHCVLC